MKRLLSIFSALVLLAGFTACEEQPDTQNQTPTTVEIKVDKLSIVADGEDVATFQVLVNDAERTSECQIINLEDNSILENYTFSTTTAGTYSFKAAFGSATSESIRITATAKSDDGNGNGNENDGNGNGNGNGNGSEDDGNNNGDEQKFSVVLSVDKSEIVANNTDTATFTVTVDGEDKTSECTIQNLNYGIAIDGNAFSSDVSGEFKFEATYNGEKSNQVIVNATAAEKPAEKTLTLKVDNKRIKADGEAVATFTVTLDNEDVTSKSEIVDAKTNEKLSGTTFSTTTVGEYSFHATYNGTKSNMVTVMAYNPELSSDYNIGDIIERSGSKGMVYAFKELPVYNEDYTTVIGYDTYCYVVSIDQVYIQWSTENVQCGCHNPQDGSKNMLSIKYQDSTFDKYPAAKWCAEHGEGWYLPASNELHMMWDAISDNKHVFSDPSVAEFNEILKNNGGDVFEQTFYWTSNEVSESTAEVVCFSDGKGVCLDINKSSDYDVRAVYKFKVE